MTKEKLLAAAKDCTQTHKVAGCFITEDGECFMTNQLNLALNSKKKLYAYAAGSDTLQELGKEEIEKLQSIDGRRMLEAMASNPNFQITENGKASAYEGVAKELAQELEKVTAERNQLIEERDAARKENEETLDLNEKLQEEIDALQEKLSKADAEIAKLKKTAKK